MHFGYTPERKILDGLTFSIPAGKRVALVGPSGCGKSTILRLLYRFYEPSSGYIAIDGQAIDDVTVRSLRESIGVVPQDTPLFHADVRHNVRYGRMDASDAEVEEAARRAQVHDAVSRLPQGYSTTVGERGLMISGGEKQRLAVARVLLKDPPIVFFDEATSALDAKTEADLMRNIRENLLDKKRTSIFIAHRLRTVVDAGRRTSEPLVCKLMPRQISSSCFKTDVSSNRALMRSLSGGKRGCITRCGSNKMRSKKPSCTKHYHKLSGSL